MTDTKNPFEWVLTPGDPADIEAARNAPPTIEDHIWALVQEGLTTPNAEVLLYKMLPTWRERWTQITTLTMDVDPEL